MGFNGKVIDVSIEETSGQHNAVIKMLNYDKLYVVTAIDADKYSYIKYDTEVKAVYENQEISAQIRTIGYEIEEGKIPVTVSLDKNVLPGSKMRVVFTTGKQEKGMYVLKEAVYQDGDDFYADIKVDDDIVRVEITVGQEFVDDSDEITRSYIEILSGVEADDVLVAKRAGAGARDTDEK